MHNYDDSHSGQLSLTPVRKRRTLLAPAAYSETMMPALRLARASRWTKQLAKVLIVLLVLTVFLLAFVPWQQNVAGSGSVLAFAPDQRQQIIEAPIKGRIVRWGEDVVENTLVEKGQFIAEIRDLDESYTARLEQQLANSELTAASAERQLEASKRALQAAEIIVNSYEAQVRAYEKVKQETIAAQDAYVDMAREKVRAEQQQLAEYDAAIPQLQAERDRVKRLEAEGNVSLQKLQEVEREMQEAEAKVSRASAYVSAAEADLAGKTRERTAKIEKAQVDIDYAEALLQKSRGDISKAESDVAKSEQEYQKAQKVVLEMQTKVARQQSQTLVAPFEGYIVQIQPNLNTAIVHEGDPICTIVPRTSDRSVQIWLNGNDAPLVEPGRHVRLQFEGWPALQFSGWPSVAVGTFGGEVVSVDATDNGMGEFRVLVRPAKDSPQWPQERFLRQGVRANGWVLLDQVPLWYEVWRRLNGFPPVVSLDSPKEKTSKVPKLPK